MKPYHSPGPPSLGFLFLNRLAPASTAFLNCLSVWIQPLPSLGFPPSITMFSVGRSSTRYSFSIFPLRENCQSTGTRFPPSSRILPLLNRSSNPGIRPGISTSRGYSGLNRGIQRDYERLEHETRSVIDRSRYVYTTFSCWSFVWPHPSECIGLEFGWLPSENIKCWELCFLETWQDIGSVKECMRRYWAAIPYLLKLLFKLLHRGHLVGRKSCT